MTQARHTPGPWKIILDHVRGHQILSSPTDNVAHLEPWLLGARTSEQEANGHLIAAAPELLRDLKEAHELAVAHGWTPAARVGWFETIAKARGE